VKLTRSFAVFRSQMANLEVGLTSEDELNKSTKRWGIAPRVLVGTASLAMVGFVAVSAFAKSFGLKGSMDSLVTMDDTDGESDDQSDDQGDVKLFTLGVGSACRINTTDHDTISPPDGIILHVSRDKCMEECLNDEKCSGLEYRETTKRCELWHTLVGSHDRVFMHRSVHGIADFECMLKDPKCDDVKLHLDRMKKAVKKQLEYVKAHCRSGPIDDDMKSKCARVYSADLLSSEEEFCREANKQCGTSMPCTPK